MKLTDKQLKIQEYADKTLGFGCLIYNEEREQYWYIVSDENTYLPSIDRWISWYYNNKIIWHPMDYSRLDYLHRENKDNWYFDHLQAWEEILWYVSDNHEILLQTVLERSEEFIDLVITFLETLPKE